MNALECAAFGTYCDSNQKLWNWLKDNAHLYGFAISYPENKQNVTGYVYEPWHYRWIGKEFAKEFKETGSTSYLAEFLRNKELF